MDVMSRGKCVHGIDMDAPVPPKVPHQSLSTMRKSRPNLSRIWSRHWICRADGQTIKHPAGPVANDQFQIDHARLRWSCRGPRRRQSAG